MEARSERERANARRKPGRYKKGMRRFVFLTSTTDALILCLAVPLESIGGAESPQRADLAFLTTSNIQQFNHISSISAVGRFSDIDRYGKKKLYVYAYISWLSENFFATVTARTSHENVSKVSLKFGVVQPREARHLAFSLSPLCQLQRAPTPTISRVKCFLWDFLLSALRVYPHRRRRRRLRLPASSLGRKFELLASTCGC